MHKELKASRRYAKSLLDFAIDEGTLTAVTKDMDVLHKAFIQNKELVKMLRTPLVKADVKGKILKKIFTDNISPITMRFLLIITAKRRESILPGIARSFEEQVREHNGIALAEITTAVPIDQKQRDGMKSLLGDKYPKLELKEIVDPDIIAGFSIKVGDKLFDETIESRIKALKKYYRNNPYIAKL